ncbi:MAG: hypothetical protein ACRCTS_06960 [Fusobacteriaceae bacterium]
MFIIGYSDAGLESEVLINTNSVVEISAWGDCYELELTNGALRYIKEITYRDLKSSACEIENRR